MSYRNRPADIEAQISLLTTSQGGRRTPALSGYHPNHDFGSESGLNDALHEYVGRDSVAPGETSLAKIWFLAPEYQTGRLFPGFKFTVQEGPRIIGHGVVTQVLNESLRKPGT